MLSYAVFLRGDAFEPKEKKPAKMHMNEGIILEGQIGLAERIVVSLKSEIGDEKTAALLEHIAK